MNMVTVISLLGLLFLAKSTNAETYTVGGPKGWTFGIKKWPNGKSFVAGDVLDFGYNPKMHNVVLVDQTGYDKCKTPEGSKVFRTGSDQIELVKGDNYFICNLPGHCQSGMKIYINAA
uniref:Basic blue protein n=1 Tax=Medicago sativa subsp. varia TaxID=36902 RepID=Q9SBR9_MEDSV|nr:basic blue protein [Medicago sativa subsp. x varia]